MSGPGTVTVRMNGLNHKHYGRSAARNFFTIYQSDVDGSLSFNQVKAQGLVDSTINQGLTYITRNQRNNYTRCYGYDNPAEITVSRSLCDTFKPRRYYIVASATYANRNIWFDIKYDSNSARRIDTIQPKYDLFHQGW
jgi:hypothetical protein